MEQLVSLKVLIFKKERFHGSFSIGNGFGRNAIIFGVDMSFSVHVDNKKKDILMLSKDPTQGLDGTTLTVKKLYSINFTGYNGTKKLFIC